jgi:hypothetical protein
LVWALIILENELCSRYFDVVKLDDCDRPQVLKSLDYGIKGVISPLSLYSNEKDSGINTALPTIFQEDAASTDLEMDDLRRQGWYLPGESYFDK